MTNFVVCFCFSIFFLCLFNKNTVFHYMYCQSKSGFITTFGSGLICVSDGERFMAIHVPFSSCFLVEFDLWALVVLSILHNGVICAYDGCKQYFYAIIWKKKKGMRRIDHPLALTVYCDAFFEVLVFCGRNPFSKYSIMEGSRWKDMR